MLRESVLIRATDARLHRDLSQLWRVRDGRLAFLRVFRTKQDALEATGTTPL